MQKKTPVRKITRKVFAERFLPKFLAEKNCPPPIEEQAIERGKNIIKEVRRQFGL